MPNNIPKIALKEKMEKIFKAEFVNTRKPNSMIALHNPRDTSKSFLYQARDVGYEYNEKGYYHKRENGVCHLVLYTKSGSALLEYDGQEIQLKPNSLLFISLAQKSVIKAPDSHWEIYFMHVMGASTEEIYRTVCQYKGYLIENFSEKLFTDGILSLYEKYKSSTIDYYSISQTIYSMLLDVVKQSQPSYRHELVQRAISYISQNYAKKLNLEDICKQLFVSKYFFIRKFHAEVGCSPKQYITKIRLERAKYMLIHTDSSVAEIANAVGFENEKNIYYAFKSALGLSPREYKENFM